MGSIRIDMTGQQFGYLKVNSYSHTENKRAFWNCTCVCGKEIVCKGKLLRNGHIKSCGCMKNKMVSDAKIDDMKGRKIGRLYFKEYVGLFSHHALWLCKCDCGKECIVKASSVKSGTTSSCGCLAHDILMERNCKHNCVYLPIYKCYHNMISRCTNKNTTHYKDYGGRGIKICDEWLDKDFGFKNFYDWAMKNGYNEELTIDRIDFNGNYEPNNCRWATIKQQANNKRNNVFVEYDGKKYSIAELSDVFSLNYDRTLSRHHKGWTPSELVQGFRA